MIKTKYADAKDADAPTSSSGTVPPPALYQDPLQPLPIPIETTLRMTAGAFCGYCLAYSNSSTLEKVLPKSLQWVVGLLASVLVLRVPPLAITVVGSLGIFYTAMMFGLLSVTLLLYAATVSDGLFIGMVALWTLWMSGLRYGITGRPLHIVGSALCCFFGMVGLGMHFAIRDGISMTLTKSFLEDLLNMELPTIAELRAETAERQADIEAEISAIVVALRDGTLLERAQGLLDDMPAYLPVLRSVLLSLYDILFQDECTQLDIPVGTFEGRTATICIDEESGEIGVSIKGGIWLIQKCWTAGVMNPIAIFPNIIVVCSWTFLCVYVSPLLPLPAIRTLRFSLSRIVLPQVLKDAAWYLEATHATSKSAEIDVDQVIEDDRVVKKRLIGAVQVLHGGTIGLATAFEPRVLLACQCTTGGPRNTWVPLKNLMIAVEHMAVKALAAKVIDPVQSHAALSKAIVQLEQTATILRDPSVTAVHSKEEPNYTLATTSPSATLNKAEGVPQDDEESSDNKDPLGFAKLSQEISDATQLWLESMNPTTIGTGATTNEETSKWNWTDGVKHVLITGAVWALPSLALLGRLLQIIILPLLVLKNSIHLDTEKVFHCVKFAAGFTALTALTVYSEGYRNFTVTRLEDSEGVDLVLGNPPSSFAGWDLVRYVYGIHSS